MKKRTYANSGVDIDKEDDAIKELVSMLTFRRTGVGTPLGGHYAGMIDFGEYALILCTDGVGSKLMIASAIKKWDTIGIDCIAMNINDCLCVGGEPLAFVDYLALEKPDPVLMKEIGKGLNRGAQQANISIISGETASLPDIVKGFDLAGTCLGYVKKKDIVTGETIQPGDIIVGLSSSGIHSNGYSLVRNIIDHSKFSYSDFFPNNLYPGQTIGEVLLTPTHIYVKEILALLHQIDVHGLAHITGSGLWNLPRLKETVQYTFDSPFEPQPIFEFLQNYGNIDDHEMYQTFNMGMGFAIVIQEDDVQQTLQILKKHSSAKAQVVGRIEKGKGVYVPIKHLRYGT